jgi:hypothetical protein
MWRTPTSHHRHGDLPVCASEMARRRELGALANKSLNITCFTSKIKCENCGFSYMSRNTRKNRAKVSQLGDQLVGWVCGSSKNEKRQVQGDGGIPEYILRQKCAEALGLEEFDEDAFAEQVEVHHGSGAGHPQFSHDRTEQRKPSHG